jgi:pilus assembly protein CpaE
MLVTSASSLVALTAAHLGAQPADVVVLDIRDQDRVPAGLAQLKKEHPATGIVIVARTFEPSLMLDAMRASVNEYMIEPFTRADLAAAITRIAAEEHAPSACDVLAFVGVKGGVGVTTLAVNVATALARKAPGSVLLIDLNPAGGDAAVFLGAEPQASMLDALQNAARLDEVFLKGLVEKTHAGPDLLASPDHVVRTEADPETVAAVVEAASRCYRHVVLDVPRTDPSVGSALKLASSITVVATQNAAALRRGHRLTTFLRQRYGEHRVRVVLNRFDRSADIGEEDVEITLGGPLASVFTPEDRRCVEALNRGMPIVQDRQSKLAAELRAYARALVKEFEPEKPFKRKPRLFGIRGGRPHHPPGE